jgi:short-subunit dehydrogenase
MLFKIIIFFLIISLLHVKAYAETDAPYAVVAGGSKGIGYAIAEALAKRHYNLLLIARHRDGLIAAKQKLEFSYPVHVEILINDLSLEESAKEVAEWCIAKKLKVKVLCNVAGFGGANDYLSLPLDTVRYMIRLNIESAVALTYTMLNILKQNQPSYILNVASMAGLAPIPQKNVYSATKSAIVSFSYALHYQLKPYHISVSCLAPGPVYTKPEIIKDTHDKLGKFGDLIEVSPSRVGERAVKKTLQGKMLIIPGFVASVSAETIRLLPKKVITALYSGF